MKIEFAEKRSFVLYWQCEHYNFVHTKRYRGLLNIYNFEENAWIENVCYIVCHCRCRNNNITYWPIKVKIAFYVRACVSKLFCCVSVCVKTFTSNNSIIFWFKRLASKKKKPRKKCPHVLLLLCMRVWSPNGISTGKINNNILYSCAIIITGRLRFKRNIFKKRTTAYCSQTIVYTH